MLSTSVSANSLSTTSLVHYSVSSVRDLPADAQGTGVLSDGSVYVEPYKMLTENDQTLLKGVTGESFDSVTIASAQAAGTFKGNALAAAIGWDRATGVLSGSISTGYLNTIETALNTHNSTNTYEGFRVAMPDIAKAFASVDKANLPSLSVSA